MQDVQEWGNWLGGFSFGLLINVYVCSSSKNQI